MDKPFLEASPIGLALRGGFAALSHRERTLAVDTFCGQESLFL
jgi:hypothetical protein